MERTRLGFFQRYLTVRVILCMAAGVAVGRFLPAEPTFLDRFEVANVNFGLPMIVGVLVEVPVVLLLIRISNRTKGSFDHA